MTKTELGEIFQSFFFHAFNNSLPYNVHEQVHEHVTLLLLFFLNFHTIIQNYFIFW